MAENPSASDSTAKPDAPAEPSLKEQGNALFRAGNYLKAAALYTQAIKEDPENHALYRSVKLARFSLMSPLCSPLQPAVVQSRSFPLAAIGQRHFYIYRS